MGNDAASDLLARASDYGSAGGASRWDLLSQLLTLIRLRGDLIYAAELSAPWRFSFPAGPAHFHFVLEGGIHVGMSTDDAVFARSGDLVLLPLGGGHVMSDRPAGDDSDAPLFSTHIDTDQLLLTHAGPGQATRLVSGTFHFDGHVTPTILGALPSLIRISRSDGGNAEWLEALVHFLLAEARMPAPGSAIMISRLIDVLVVRTLRSWTSASQGGLTGWPGALGDERIERALAAVHGKPAHPWTVEGLARIAAISRSIFAEHFAELVGEPPLHYVKRLRLSLASDMIGEGSATVGDIGRRIGYASEAAFSRAYKSRFGHSPSEDLPTNRSGDRKASRSAKPSMRMEPVDREN